jgi:hypothetical protein
VKYIRGKEMTKTELVAAARSKLGELEASLWTGDQINNIHDIVIKEISQKCPLLKFVNLPLIQYTKCVDISSLSNVIRIIPQNEVESPIGVMRDSIYRSATELELQLNSVPEITTDTLTGTLTFVQNSRAVSGSGTAFTTELNEDDLICLSDGTKYYQIAHVTDDTNLVLSEPFLETGESDDDGSTIARSYKSVVRICYGAYYTVSTSSDMPVKFDPVAIAGIVANCASEYVGNYLNTKLTAITTSLSSASTSAGNASARITQAITDINTGRTNLGTDLTTYDATLTAIETALAAVATSLASATSSVASVSPGGDISKKHTEVAIGYAEQAKQRIERARSILDSAKTNHDYLDISTQELTGAGNYVNQAKSYIDQSESAINVTAIIKEYRAWANDKMNEYQKLLNSIGRVSDYTKHNCSRSV